VWQWVYWLRMYVWYRGLTLPPSLWVPLIAAVLSAAGLAACGAPALSVRARRNGFEYTIIGIVCVLVLSGCSHFMQFWAGLTWCVTNPARYAQERQWFHEWMTGHFPLTIPENATNVHFFYSPGPLQDSAHLQLRVTLPPDDVAALLKKYGHLESPVCVCGTEFGRCVRDSDFLTKDENRSMGKSQAPFPDSYKFLYLGPYSVEGARPRALREDSDPCDVCMDGPASLWGYGLAIDAATCDVVFWAEECSF